VGRRTLEAGCSSSWRANVPATVAPEGIQSTCTRGSRASSGIFLMFRVCSIF
jgi:hypothetical protein